MDKQTIIMHKTTIKRKFYRSERFRIPQAGEKQIGLWVDRIGSAVDIGKPQDKKLRILGLYAAVYVCSGEGFFDSESSGIIRVKAGDTILLFPEEAQIYYPDSKWATKWIVWSGKEADTLTELRYLSPSRPVVTGNFEAVENAFYALKKIIDKEDLTSVYERKKILTEMIFSLHKSSSAENERNNYNQSTVRKAVNKILRKNGMNISIRQLAGEAGFSETHFHRIFTLFSGRPPKEYILSVKINQAKKCLSEGKTIKETAEFLGFHFPEKNRI
jgi:AraC-like DNA-binding protein